MRLDNMDLVKLLISMLPRFSEELNDYYGVSRDDLRESLANKSNQTMDTINSTLLLVERILVSLSLLDRKALDEGLWYFVSFPAQLMALSILNTMTDSKSSYFPEKFWTVDPNNKEQKNGLRDIPSVLIRIDPLMLKKVTHPPFHSIFCSIF
jgi:hypothetical protein